MAEILMDSRFLHLRNDRISYIIRIVNGRWLMHAYFGRRLRGLNAELLPRFLDRREADLDLHESPLDTLPQEMPSFGYGDMREGALRVTDEGGFGVVGLSFEHAEVLADKPALPGLPATFGEGKTLRVTLADKVIGLACDLYYTIFDDCDVIARHTELRNTGRQRLTLRQVMSASADFPHGEYDLLTLSGAWSRERHVVRRPAVPGKQGVSSLRGASSHQCCPFMALMSRDATELSGDVYGFALVYSGNFRAEVTVDQFGQPRAMIGLGDVDFSWQLDPGASFVSPEAVLTYSPRGLSGMSEGFHTLIHRHLTRGQFAASRRPILINNWEATYFDFDEEKLVSIANKAAEIGVELFVLDDGWFGRRDADNCSLGDWTENLRKLPGGLARLSERIHGLGMRFGLWFEPEMVSPDSDLYRAHPDWCLHVPGRERVEGRHQLVLDMSRADVCAYVTRAVSDVLSRVPIDYVKWDMNRNFSPVGSAALPACQQGEVAHRYMLGLYGVLEKVVTRFDHVLFESCAGGGGRFDLGMLYYMPQTWCSDNTDADSRCFIQYGTSLLMPPSAMGAHVSAVPNHQTGRVTRLTTRSDVAMGGTYGFELDVTKLSEEEIAQMRTLLARVKCVRDTLLYGDFHRLRDPFTGNVAAWMTVSPDKREAVVTAVKLRAVSNEKPDVLLLRGLDPAMDYRVEETGEVLGGDELMFSGLTLPFPSGDDASLSYILRAV